MNAIKEYFNSISYPSLLKRLLLLLIPVVCMPLGIACYYACGLGADPFSIFVDGEHVLFQLSYGQITTMNNSILLLAMVIWGRKYLNIGTIITCFSTGPLIDIFKYAIDTNIAPIESGYLAQALVLAGASVIFAVGVGVYIAINIGVGPLDFINLSLCDKFNFKLKYVRIVMDAIFVVVGFLMGGVIGVGTIVGVVVTGPIVEFTLKRTGKWVEAFAGPYRKGAAQAVNDG